MDAIKSQVANALQGAGTLREMLDCIGEPDLGDDKTIAQLLVDNEMTLRELLAFSVRKLAEVV